jgi:hypothetical protein
MMMSVKTSYDDPTNATDPPGGKHHDAAKKSNDGTSGHKREERGDHQDFDGDKGRKTVREDKVRRAEK